MAIVLRGRTALSAAAARTRTRTAAEPSTRPSRCGCGGRRPHPPSPPTKGRAAARAKATTAMTAPAPPAPSLPGKLWEKYTEALLARPLLVKGTAASLIFMASDTCAQRLSSDGDGDGAEWSWDASRALSGAGFGVVATTWLHYWWGFLEVAVNRRLPVSGGASKLVNTLAKVAVDQLVGAPLYIYSYYCVTHFGKEWASRIASGRDDTNNKNEGMVRPSRSSLPSTATETKTTAAELMKETSDRAWRMLPDTLWRHWSIWPVVHTVNFYFNPIHHRVLTQNVVLMFWSGYLSHLNNGGGEGGSRSSLMTPAEEIETTVEIHRRETARLQQRQRQMAKSEHR